MDASDGHIREEANPKTQRAEVDGVFPLMPQQYYDLISRRRIIDGERRLMFAVFEDAIRSYVMCMSSKSQARRREFEEVKAWIELRGHHSVFSFDSLCELFEIDPDLLASSAKDCSIRPICRAAESVRSAVASRCAPRCDAGASVTRSSGLSGADGVWTSVSFGRTFFGS